MVSPRDVGPRSDRKVGYDDHYQFRFVTWYKSLNIRERKRVLKFAEHPDEIVYAKAREELADWRKTMPLAKEDLFHKRLAEDKLSEEQLLRVLAYSPKPNTALNETFQWLSRAMAANCNGTPNTATGPSFSLPSDDPQSQMISIFAPLLMQAWNECQQAINTIQDDHVGLPFDVAAVRKIVTDMWLRDLPWIINRVLVLELNVARLSEALEGPTPSERFSDFIRQMHSVERLLALFSEYPVFGRRLTAYLEQSVRVVGEFLSRLSSDWTKLVKTFAPPGESPGGIVALNGLAGDRHCDGRSVCIATFASGWKIVYKPRPLSLDEHFQEFLTWLNQRDGSPDFRLLKVWNRGEYGWVEYVKHAGCSSQFEVEEFYKRQGGYLALLYALGATDFHFENIVAAGSNPVLLDLESIFHPPRVLAEDSLPGGADREIVNSVLGVGLLPFRIWHGDNPDGIDISGIGATAAELSPDRLPFWQSVGTDEMHLERHRAHLDSGDHRPTLNDEPVQPLAYTDDLVAGFRQVYRILLKHRDQIIAPDGPLSAFHGDRLRVILRNTREYAVLLQESFHPDLLRDAVAQDHLFDCLWTDVERDARLGRVVAAERRDLQNGDIPIFTTYLGCRDLWTSSGQRISRFFSTHDATHYKKRLRSLSEHDLVQQEWFIRASLASTVMGKQFVSNTTSRISSRDKDNQLLSLRLYAGNNHDHFRERAITAASEVGRRLERLAIRTGKGANWIGLAFVNARHWSVAPCGLDLYAGLPGVALFLAYLGHVTHDRRHTDLARDASRIMLHQVKQAQARGKATSIGVFTGWAGIIHTCLHLGVLWNRTDLLEMARELTGALPAYVDQDISFDIIGGAAGCVPTLIHLYHHFPLKEIYDTATRCGDWLLANAQPMHEGVAWLAKDSDEVPLAGFSHGASGIAWSLVLLGEFTSDPRFFKAARQALVFERTLFCHERKNWRDRRADPTKKSLRDQESSFMTAWCNGAPGVGLSRLGMLGKVDDDGLLKDEISVAVSTTLHDGFDDNASLCHGDLGNLIFLQEAAMLLRDDALLELTRERAMIIIDRFEDKGFVCGTPLHVESPGLMTGLAGIGYALLRLALPHKVPNILTLEGPAAESL